MSRYRDDDNRERRSRRDRGDRDDRDRSRRDRGYDRDRRDRRDNDRRDRRGYGDRRSGGYDRDRRSGGHGGGYRNNRRGGFRGRGRGRGRGGKNIVRYHDEQSSKLIQEVSNKIGLVGRNPITQEVKIYTDSEGRTWQERRTVKNGKPYFLTDGLRSTYVKPDDLIGPNEVRKENYAPAYPKVVEWAKMNAKTTEVSPNCFRAELSEPLYRYECLDLEERNTWGVRKKMFPRELSFPSKRKLRNAYQARFGDFTMCDGFIVSNQDIEEKGEIEFEEDGYTVTFRNNGQVLLDETELSSDTPERVLQMLMYGLHKLAEGAGFVKDAHMGRTVFWKHSDRDSSIEIRQRGNDWEAPDVLLHKVYNIKLNIGKDPESKTKKLFAFADISHKHLAAVSLREFIQHFKDKHESKEEYQKAVEDAFLRKRALVKYSSNWVKIEGFLWDENEDFEFKKKDGSITIAKYLETVKGMEIKSGAPCVVKCKIDGMRGRRFCEHLPQHLFVTVNKERTKLADAEIKDKEAMTDSDRHTAVKKFMTLFEDIQQPQFPLKITSEPLKIKAYVFPEIKLKIRSESHGLERFADGWKRNNDGFTEATDEDEFGDPKRVVILCTQRNSRTASNIKRTFQDNYLQRRGIQDCIKSVDIVEVDNWSEADISDELDRLRHEPDLVIAIIDDGKDGSRQKSILARASGGKFKTQCMVSNRAGKNAAVLGMCDDVMAKLGGCWYQVDYEFKTLDARDYWAIGIDVYCSQNDSSVSGLSIQLCSNISAGTMKNYIRGNLPLHPKEKIAPKNAFREALKKIFDKASEKGWEPPKTILIFRGGVSMGEVDLLRTNELAGTIQALYQTFGKKKRGLTYFLVPRGGTIRFFDKLRQPICVADTITGGCYQNFYTQVNTKARKTPRVVQYICLHDDGKEGEMADKGFLQNILQTEPEDWLKMIRGLCYLYPQSISFYNGPCSYPGPLKCAQNQAESFTQFIFNEDAVLADCDSLPNSLTAMFQDMSLGEDAEMSEPVKSEPVKSESSKPASSKPVSLEPVKSESSEKVTPMAMETEDAERNESSEKGADDAERNESSEKGADDAEQMND